MECARVAPSTTVSARPSWPVSTSFAPVGVVTPSHLSNPLAVGSVRNRPVKAEPGPRPGALARVTNRLTVRSQAGPEEMGLDRSVALKGDAHGLWPLDRAARTLG